MKSLIIFITWSVLRILLLIGCISAAVYLIAITDPIGTLNPMSGEIFMRLDENTNRLALALLVLLGGAFVQLTIAVTIRMSINAARNAKEKADYRSLWVFELPFTVAFQVAALITLVCTAIVTSDWMLVSPMAQHGIGREAAVLLVLLNIMAISFPWLYRQYSKLGTKKTTS